MSLIRWRRTLRRFGRLVVVAGLLVASLGLAAASGQPATRQGRVHRPSVPKPTIVLVHGAWADASGWDGVIRTLHHRGYRVIAPADPLRGLASDAAYVSSILSTIPGPVVLVGHSYGGAVLTGAANGHPNVEALVYIAAFAPDAEETIGGLTAMNPGSMVGPAALDFRPYPGGVDAYIKPGVFRKVFAADVPAIHASVMATSQRPISANILTEPAGAPAWKTIPSWYLIASQDKTIPPATQRFMARRAHARTIEIRSSHVAMVSHPQAVTNLILRATYATR